MPNNLRVADVRCLPARGEGWLCIPHPFRCSGSTLWRDRVSTVDGLLPGRLSLLKRPILEDELPVADFAAPETRAILREVFSDAGVVALTWTGFGHARATDAIVKSLGQEYMWEFTSASLAFADGPYGPQYVAARDATFFVASPVDLHVTFVLAATEPLHRIAMACEAYPIREDHLLEGL